ncbi:MAG: tetratricopeptide repeat protein [Acidobacteria bacterium]|nr:tetratricopeptide repeat protein [Acidobacteriota bacterium]
MNQRLVCSSFCTLLCQVVFCQDAAISSLRDAERLHAQGNYEQAVTAYDRALKEKPKLFEALVGKGRALIKLGKGLHALETCNEAVNERQSAVAFACRAEAYGRLGVDQGSQADWVQAALSDWQAALRLDPSLREAHRTLAGLFWRRGQKAEAIEEMKFHLGACPRICPDLAFSAGI